MPRKKRTAVIALSAAAVVCLGSAALLLGPRMLEPKPPWYKLGRAAHKAGVAPDQAAVGRGFAERNQRFREWLVKVVETPTEEPDVRAEAWRVLDFMQDDRKVGDAMQDIVGWMDKTPPGGPDESSVRFGIRNNILLRVLMTDLPDDEVLSIIKRARPDFWGTYLKRTANARLDVPILMEGKARLHMKERAQALLRHVAETEAAEPQPGEARRSEAEKAERQETGTQAEADEQPPKEPAAEGAGEPAEAAPEPAPPKEPAGQAEPGAK